MKKITLILSAALLIFSLSAMAETSVPKKGKHKSHKKTKKKKSNYYFNFQH